VTLVTMRAMKKMKFASFLAAALLSAVSVSHADLAGFTNHNLGGTTASWDIYYGPNYLPVFTFSTGTVGNPIVNSPGELDLVANVTSWQPGPPIPANGQATGPIDSNGSTIPGNREQFYTFFGSIAWNVAGLNTTAMDTFTFQVGIESGSGGSLTNMTLNGIAPSSTGFDSGSGIGFWTWTGLGIAADSNFSLYWNTGNHIGLDAFQIQSDAILTAVPEPSVTAFGIGASVLALALLGRRKRSRN
jgi:hypothetical protein